MKKLLVLWELKNKFLQFIFSEESKLRLKDALVHYEELLAENNLIASTSSATISDEIMLIGKELYDNTLEILDEKKLVTDEELIE